MNNKLSDGKSHRFEESKSGHLVPVVDGVYMHSMLDPTKEARSLAEQYVEEIEKNPVALIMGIGLGYHVHAIFESYKSLYENNDNWELYVVEADSRNVMSYMEIQAGLYPEISKRIKVFCSPVNELYQNPFFIEILLKKPLIIPHRPSYQKNLEYYHSVLKYKRDNRVSAIAPLLRKELRELVTSSLPMNQDFLASVESIEKKTTWDMADRLTLLLHSIGKDQERRERSIDIEDKRSEVNHDAK
jgi:hypothetical protein